MNPVREFIIDNIEEYKITIPWKLRKHITLWDIGFVSTDTDMFETEKKYSNRISIVRGEFLDYMSISSSFENHENICLMQLVARGYCCRNLFPKILDSNKYIFSDEYIAEATKFASDHNLTNLAKVINTIYCNITEDNDEFRNFYLKNFGCKPAE